MKVSAASAEDGHGQLAAKRRDLAEQRGLERLDPGEQRAHPADLAGIAGRGDHAPAAAKDDQGAGKGHRAPVAERRPGGDRLGRLLDRERFAGQGRLLRCAGS